MGGPEADKIQSDLFELVVTRDNIGEAMWYVYTGILVASIVQLKINAKGCDSTSKSIETNYQEYV
jgi:hypothetical protein